MGFVRLSHHVPGSLLSAFRYPPAVLACFVMMTQDNFTFKTRQMELDTLEARSRVKRNYQDALVLFHEQTSSGVDMRLFDLVDFHGLKKLVERNVEWKQIRDELRFAGSVRELVKVYHEVVEPFEAYLGMCHVKKVRMKLPRDKRVSKEKPVDLDRMVCERCRRGDHSEHMLLCDDCNRGYHMFCLEPKMVHVPDTEWVRLFVC